jgi:uncharacterized repeat protein (TIGR01451 family)
VTTANNCSWTANPTVSWITITSAPNGSGNGTVAYSASANTSPAARTGMITVADQAFTLTQGGAGGQAELSVALTPTPNPVAAGIRLTFAITVHNAGPDPATGVTLSTATPAGTTFAQLAGSGSATTPTIGQAGPITSLVDSIPAGGSADFMLAVNVIGAPGSSLLANASVSSLTTDPVPGNNSASATTEILGGGVVELSWDQAPSTAADPTPPPTNLKSCSRRQRFQHRIVSARCYPGQ